MLCDGCERNLPTTTTDHGELCEGCERLAVANEHPEEWISCTDEDMKEYDDVQETP